MHESISLSIAFIEHQPKAAAAMLQEFSAEEILDFCQEVPTESLVPVIEQMASWPAARALSLFPEKMAAKILRELPSAEAESLLRLMATEQRDQVMQHLPDRVAKSFVHKLSYPLSAVGAWMDTSVPYFTLDSSVEHCLDLVKRQKSHLAGVVIVVSEQRHLVGLVEVEKLLTCEGSQKLASLLNRDIAALPARATLWEVEHHEGWTQFPTLPVVDHNNIMLGALTHSALRSGMTKSAAPTASHKKFSIVAHMGRAFFISVSGLLQVISSTSPDATARKPLATPPTNVNGGAPR